MKKKLLFIPLCLLVLFACNRNKLNVDISDVSTEPLQLLRLEDDVFALKDEGFDAATLKIKQKYGWYYEHYLMSFIARRGTGDSAYKNSLLNFISDHDVKQSFAYVKKLYPAHELEAMMPEVNNMVKRFHYHFPAKKLPTRLLTCTSGWNYAFAYLDSTMVLSLDMYLGDTAKFYGMLRYPQYQVRKMNKHYLLPDMARGWLLTEFDNSEAENILLNHCIFYGKLFYSVNALLPNTHDSLIIGYTGSQLNYCKSYEKNLWGYFAEKNRLYENNMNTIRELTSDGPFSGAISKECPPRIAMWVGWQIVKSYMDNNPNVTLLELMNEASAQKILNKSKYRP
ncbi:MAG: hypothetical protein IT236_05550 [Bacteroidia bacterium]|nr:hypothetical protein [Bacteroidia bacterium]